MKKLLPVLMYAALLLSGYLLYTKGGLQIGVFVAICAVPLLGILLRPRNKASNASPQSIKEALGQYAADVFTDDSKPSETFQAAANDMAASKPKAALAKTEKLLSQCRNDKERYAVAIVRAESYFCQRMFKEAIHEYNQAVILNPTAELALKIGSCHQRLGQLRKAIDSYEFALDLDPRSVSARSALATAWVAEQDYENALNHAELALELEETNSSALATTAICHGLLGNTQLSEEYTAKAENQGYSRKKIEDTIKALRK